MGGAMLMIGSVLYPYVYVMARTAFLLTPAPLLGLAYISAKPFGILAFIGPASSGSGPGARSDGNYL